MGWRDTTGALVVSTVLVSLSGMAACATNPPPATPAPSVPSTTGQNLGGLYFDPQGADFTLWVNTFKNEVYRNWIVPPAAIREFRGHVDFEFTVERDGSMSALRMLKSSGTTPFDSAARDALGGSRFLPLPEDYKPSRVRMHVTFFYNESPFG
jgi:TonB family protein